MNDWPALKRWNLDDLARRFGDCAIAARPGPYAADHLKADEEPPPRTLRMAELVAMIRDDGASDRRCWVVENDRRNRDELSGLWSEIGPFTEFLHGNDVWPGSLWLGSPGAIASSHYYLTS